MDRIILDENHIYWRMLDDSAKVREPGFTEICRAMGSEDNEFWDEDGREEGTALAKWMHFLAKGDEPEEAPDPRIAGRVEGFKKFMRESNFEFVGGEQPLYNPILRHCVTPDLWGYIGDFSWCIDGKRGAKIKKYDAQTAAQVLALKENGFPVEKRGCLYLTDGDYRLREHEDADDYKRWFAIAMGYHASRFYWGNK